MSKRKGDYITVEDLISEVGKDATRFIMLNRSSDAELDFDFDNVIEKSKDNHLYYVQYSYARIASVFRHLNKDLKSDLKIKDFTEKYEFLLLSFMLVGAPPELFLATHTSNINLTSDQLATFLAKLFHKVLME